MYRSQIPPDLRDEVIWQRFPVLKRISPASTVQVIHVTDSRLRLQHLPVTVAYTGDNLTDSLSANVKF